MAFATVRKLSGQSGKFPDFWKLKHLNKYVAKAIYALLVNFAKTIYALLAQMSPKKFTHFVRKVFARKILPTGKLGFFRPLIQGSNM